MKKYISICLLITAFASTLCVSCKKKSKESETTIIQLDIQDSSNKDVLNTETQLWHVTNKRVCIIFGYDFNSPETVEKFTNILQAKYGLENEGGLIYTMVYPDSFKHSGRSYVSELSQDLTGTDKDIAGIIILGAPENTHKAFAKIQDFWEQNVPYPIYALFPQDDVLGLESTCDFVLDKEQDTNLDGEIVSEETTSQIILNAPEVLTECIDYMLEIEGPFEKNSTLPKHVEQMLKNQKIHHYVDPESGIQSINHFVLD